MAELQSNMSKIFITGSADIKGLGMLSAKRLIADGHQVVLHARSADRAADAKKACPEADAVLVADLSSTEETRHLATELNRRGPWSCIIHNAGLYTGTEGRRGKEGLPALFAVNTLAPYMLTCLVQPPPQRLIFVSSGLHSSGDASLRDIKHCGYGDSKLHNIMLAQYFSQRFKSQGVKVHSLDPGWVATKMGGVAASDDLQAAVDTYVALAEGTRPEHDPGQHWYQGKTRRFRAEAADPDIQTKLVNELEQIGQVAPPAAE